jgi:RNA-dependent RNA polymerase
VILPERSSLKSTTILIKGLPARTTIWDIRQFFGQYGNVVFVELSDGSRGNARTSKVRFEPPPRDTSFFQQGFCSFRIGNTMFRVSIEFSGPSSEDDTLQTPLGNPCPSSLSFLPKKFTFGVLTQPTEFMPKKAIEPVNFGHGLKLTADFRRKKLAIYFPLRVEYELQQYRIEIRFGNIKTIHRAGIDGDLTALVIVVHDPPLVWNKQLDVEGEGWTDRLFWAEEELWHRSVEVRAASAPLRTEPVSIQEQENVINFGRWTTYWVDLDKPSQEQWSVIETHLRDWNIKTKLDVNFTQIANKDPELWAILAEPPTTLSTGTSSSWSEDLALLDRTTYISLPFDVRYQLEVCISRGILSEFNIERMFLEKLLELATHDSSNSSRARLVLEYAADRGEHIYNPMALFEDQAALTYYPTTLHIPDYCALVRKVTVTPTRVYFNTPTVETTNRVVRHYKHVQEFFLRVQFTDELLKGRVRAHDTERYDEVFTRVYRVLAQGIRMGKWHWNFLAFGNSQIRENGAFFFCQPEGAHDNSAVTCDSIRQWMGNFSHISVVAKLAARLGQCFSTTRLLTCISSPKIVKIAEVERNQFCFTDGVGKISPVLGLLVSDAWGLLSAPSAFQFRMGGCKGVLVTWPEVKGTEVHIRPSQEKFPAEYNGLEIIRCSQFACAALNRQTILILSCLGVPDDVFTGMMQEQLASYDTAMTDKNRAVELLSLYVDENMTTTTIARMVKNGFMESNDPFFRTVLQLWRSWSIKALKEKARLIVDNGAFVLGGVDETGTLRGYSEMTAGRKEISQDELPQIFLQVPDPKDRDAYKVVTGVCIVGRNPSLHPGDIRVVEAVDVPELRHIKNVVLFPLTGDRDVPSMCSGGDLDGDDFFVIWDPALIPREWGHPPMNYTAPEPLRESQATIMSSIASFFVLFMKNDRLPLIAHAHLATADYEAEGPKHRKCELGCPVFLACENC